mgnify:FL=1
MKKTLRLSLLMLLILAIVFVGLAIYFLARNTSFLVSYIPDTELDANNQNVETQSNRYTELQEQEVIVPNRLKQGIFENNKTLNMPLDFQVSLWALNLSSPRQIDWTHNGNLIVANRGAGEVKLIKSSDGEYGDIHVVIDTNLKNPHGVDYFEGDLYVGTETDILVYKNLTEDGTYAEKQTLISNLPIDGHWSRTVKVGPDRKLYITIGSSCNICVESDERRAAMLRSNLDGSNIEVYAEGLRNTVDFIFKSTPADFTIWGVDNGRDLIGDDLPPEEVNRIQFNGNYGWPYCYGNGINNPEYPERAGYCKTETISPTYSMQAHSAPLGLTFLINDNLAQRVRFPRLIFENDLFIAFHGSWNRSIPTGYKIVRINTSETNSKEVNFITGWLDSSGKAWGRPVDVKFDKNGDLFITDDVANAIYKVEYTGSN